MFVKKQLRKASLISIGGCVMDYIGPLVNTTIIGKEYGEQGLVIAGVVSPVVTLLVFICSLLLVSSVYLKTVANSSNDKERGRRIAGTGITLALLVAGLISALLFCGSAWYLSFFHLSTDTAILAQKYLKIYSIAPVLYVVRYYVYEETFRMGKSETALAMDVTSCVSIIVFSFMGVRLFGVAGVAMANVGMLLLSTVVGVVCNTLTHSIPDIFITIDKRSIVDILKAGFTRAQTKLYYLVYTTTMYAFWGNRFGESCIAIFALLDSATAVCSAFEGVPFAAANHFGIYIGEKNTDGIRKTFQAGIQLQSVIAVIISTAVIVFAKPMAAFFGMSVEYSGQTIIALRLFAASFIFFSWLNFYNYYFFCLGVLLPGVCISATQYLVVGIGVNMLLGLIFGEYGIYVGVFLECPLALIAVKILVSKIYHTDKHRLYDTLCPDSGEIVSFDFNFREDEIMRCRNSVELEMKKRAIPSKTVSMVMLSLEESCFMTRERNTKSVYGECTVFFKNRHIELILRDSGYHADSTATDQRIVSFRAYMLQCMEASYKNQSYYLASNYNRVTFSFDY